MKLDKEMDNMKVLHINSYYSNRFFYRNLFENQKKLNIDVNAYVPVPYNYVEPNLNLGSYTKISKNHGKYDRAIFHVKHKKIYKDIQKKYQLENFEILHAHSLFSNGYIAYKIQQQYGTPYIVAARSTDLNTFFKYMVNLRKIGIDILKNASKVIFLSTSLRDDLISNYVPADLKEQILEKSVVIPNGLDAFWLANKNKPKSKPRKSEIRVIQVGIVNKTKNAMTTANAIEILNAQGYNIKLDIVGKIESKNYYQQLAKKDFVNYISPVPKEKLLQFYRNNDIFVMPSLKETFGLVYAEAISQGLPVLYSKGQGFDNQFSDGQVGYAVEKTNEKDISEKIIEILKDYETFSNNAVNSASKFDWSKIAKEYKEIYDNILVK